MFESTAEFLLFDYFRVPYRVSAPSEPGRLDACRAGDGRTLHWPRSDSGATPTDGPFQMRTLFFHGRVVPDALARPWLDRVGAGWVAVEPVKTAEGERVASIWRSADGDVYLPFDPSEAIRSFWSEAYDRQSTRRLKRALFRGYYAARPFLPRRAQIGLRRALARVQARRRFPRWPLEPSLHELYELLFEYLSEVSGSAIPGISAWPRGLAWAFVLTHDVETDAGCRRLDTLREIEREYGYRSSWNFVPKRYTVPDSVVRSLADEGFEVGVHGLYHDGRDLESRATLTARLPEIREHARRWGAVGFRSPATHRDWELMPLLPFAYDSSYPDSDPFEPRSGGCCSLLPFPIGELVELPITLPQDHTLFAILRRRDGSAWLEKSAEIRRRGGMALLITHPDYMTGSDELTAYRRLLEAYRDDDTAWRALPREVAEWWNRRRASRLELDGGKWTVAGPAADDATVVWHGTTAAPAAEERASTAGPR